VIRGCHIATSRVAPGGSGVANAMRRSRSGEVLAFMLFLALGGCAFGPDFVTPPPPSVTSFTSEPLVSIGNGQRFVEGGEVPERWWTAFGSERLNKLIDDVIANTPTLEAAEAAIKVAQFNRESATGAFFPQINLNSSSSSQLPSSAGTQLNASSTSSINAGTQQDLLGAGTTTTATTQQAYSFFTKQVQISFSPDIWGATRRNVESLEADADNRRYQKEAARLSLVGNVAKAAIEEASLRSQIAVTQRVVDIERARLGLLERQLTAGAVSGTDIIAQQTAVAQALQTLPTLEMRLTQQRNLLTALAGRYSSEQIDQKFELAQFSLPRDLPAAIPSQVIARRPDIKAAEANMHSASAQIGVAIAARLPNIVLSADIGTSAVKLAQLFTPTTAFYTLAGNITQTAFDGMSLLNKQHAAEARLDIATAQYRGAVINSFQNVADSLRALQADARSVNAARLAEARAGSYLNNIRSRQKFGAVTQLEVVDAQRAYLNTTISRIQGEAQRLTDTVALFIALGGGWSRDGRVESVMGLTGR
jgi:NodT family efflux transporter outer membrane factor (OMF) lipoprotein